MLARGYDRNGALSMVRARGLEPPRSYEHAVLNRACLPFQHARAVPKLVYDARATVPRYPQRGPGRGRIEVPRPPHRRFAVASMGKWADE
jgi:hypothetical protein